MTRDTAPTSQPATSAVQLILDELTAAGIEAIFECGGGDNHHIAITFTNTEILITDATGPLCADDLHSDRHLSGFMAYAGLDTESSTHIYTSPRSRFLRPCKPRTEARKIAASVVAYINEHLDPAMNTTTDHEIQPAAPSAEHSAGHSAGHGSAASTDPDWYDHAEPVWEPLVDALGADPVDWMWMGRVRCEGKVIEQYKHCDTRRYVNLDHEGGAWVIEVTGSAGPPTMSRCHVGRTIAAAAGLGKA